MKFMELIPLFYSGSPQTLAVGKSLQEQVQKLQQMRDDLIKQLDINTATWGLAFWEEAYNIPTDQSRPYDYRRSRVISKLRGQGTVTVALIKNIAESFKNGKVEVIEQAQEYIFKIKFTDTKGIPPNIDDLQKAIEDVKPAHLAVEFVYIYNTWADIYKFTWEELAQMTWEEVKTR